jgi:GNAT superfamily N-acetyltransferase
MSAIVEIDRRDPADVEISFFGLKPEFVARGAGRAMMSAALDVAWQSDTQRVSLHTCTLDHPGALSRYRRCGFVLYRRAIEVMDDPRCNGLIAATTAPRTPVI